MITKIGKGVGRPKGPEKRFWAKRMTEEEVKVVEAALGRVGVGNGLKEEGRAVCGDVEEVARLREESVKMKRQVDELFEEKERYRIECERLEEVINLERSRKPIEHLTDKFERDGEVKRLRARIKELEAGIS